MAVLYFLLWSGTAAYLAAALLAAGWGVWLAVMILPVWWLLDVVSAVTHWIGDTYGSSKTPWLGEALIGPSREHHVVPRKMCGHTFVNVTHGAVLASLGLHVAMGAWLAAASPTLSMLLLMWCVSVLTIGTVFANLFHRWAHDDDPPAPARILQHLRIALPVKLHAQHHRDAHRNHFSIANGWADSFLERVQFFTHLESALRRLGLMPTYHEDSQPWGCG